MRRAILLTALTLSIIALSGCGRKDDSAKVERRTQSDGTQSMTVTDGKGTKVTIAGPGTTANMPSYAPMFPGATVEATVTAPNQGGMVTFKTSASTQEVIAFYKKSAAGAGFKDNLDMTSGDTVTFSASNPNGSHTFNVVATKSDDGTHAQVTWN
jgi:hypothetical protein